jgi:predicted acyl esterase
MTHHGGLLSTFWANWYDMQVKTVQYGLGARGPRNRANPALAVCGDENLSDAQLQANRCSFGDDILAHPLDDEYHRERSAQWDRITVPFLSAGNWGGQGLHLRGNTEAFMRAASSQKWLELHGLEHWTHFYTDYGIEIQKRFFGHFLKGERTGWESEPAVRLQVRHADKFVERTEREWPIARTQWTRLHLQPAAQALAQHAPQTEASLSFDAQGDGLTFLSAPMERDTEITGPLAAHLSASSSTTDADLFLVFRVFTADLREVTFAGAIDPHTPVAQGWLRASHRELDPALAREWRPYHTHRQEQKLRPGEPVPLHIELWPTSIVVPAGCRIALSVRGRDYLYAEKTGLKLSNFKNELRGCGPFLHDDPRDRPSSDFAGRTTLHFGPAHAAWLLLPVIPPAA